MENTTKFLRRLSRFNEEIRQLMRRTVAPLKAAQEHLQACEEAEQELRVAVGRREEAERTLRKAEHWVHEARAQWCQAELDERIAHAEAETQVWALMAKSEDGTRLEWLWHEPTITSSVRQSVDNRPLLSNCFFSITRIQDNSYRFFTITQS